MTIKQSKKKKSVQNAQSTLERESCITVEKASVQRTWL